MTSAPTALPPKRSPLPRIIGFGVLAIVVVGGVVLWLSGRGKESTDDAFTEGRVVTVAPKVSGLVVELAVQDNQKVKAGDLLFRIDPRDYQNTRDRDAAQLQLAQAQLAQAQTSLEIAQVSYPAQLDQARAARAQAEATLVRAKSDLARQTEIDVRATTKSQIDAAQAAFRTAQAQLADADAKLRSAEQAPRNIEVAATQVKQWEAQVAAAQAELAQAELNLSYTTVVAPQDGWVTKRAVEKGNYLQVSQSAMTLVTPEVWVVANFKENQLKHMRVGQPVDIEVDAFPDLKLTGAVDSFQMGTGSRFTAFPAENATGNFVKIVQRLPVKIKVTGGLPADHPLPLGLSVEPTVNLN
ncbi:HlyD family secretion protein [Nitrospirillum viridazoti]|uniref:Multidrug export protein EmrA n=1 Tax=Nitrospirillum viridazoti CBAmc TaxID=1441467 RepID=A0A248JY76_9PROT|nr:HlyD family secretion protein [Nitrospirillum amazonense]ASG23476.1 multidrug export protein EmrA [Nitrospirillum amazonense CBAmc]TWB39831.1 membrane fusion protein (multidrug efflux system) [Nitrospirillum amazonense]